MNGQSYSLIIRETTKDGVKMENGISFSTYCFLFLFEGMHLEISVRFQKGRIYLIIQSGTVRMGSGRTYRQSKTNYTTLSLWNNATGSQAFMSFSDSKKLAHDRRDIGNLLSGASQAYSNALEEQQSNKGTDPTVSQDTADRADSMNRLFHHFQSIQNTGKSGLDDKVKQMEKIRQDTLNYLLYILFGHRYGPSAESALDNEDSSTQTASSGSKDTSSSDVDIASNTGGRYYSYSSYYEKEVTGFDTKGKVVTADGREIDFNINVSMSRTFYEASETEINFGAEKRMKDPLVINLNSNIASVSDQKFFFDIDADGELDEISMLSSGSGYLALDKNGDGTINDGSELFGTASGNGFADLAAYDEDGNGWIDEADAIFSKLKIWCMDENGNSHLYGLSESGVGAIYLGSEATEFSLKSASNETNAVIRQSGVFLYENGTVGTIQQMDLAT